MLNHRKPFSIVDRLKSFTHAFRGITGFFKSEHNAIIHLVATVVVVALGFWLSLSAIEWVMIIVAVGMVFSAEIFNSAIEKLADEITTDFSQSIKKIKDFSAAAVLVTAIAAAIIGLILLLPPLIEKISGLLH
jgi:diacylglycerol kinase (ATP)